MRFILLTYLNIGQDLTSSSLLVIFGAMPAITQNYSQKQVRKQLADVER